MVSHQEWVDARRALFTKEQELLRLQAEVSRTRRELPWERLEKSYRFAGPDGEETLAELFGVHDELIIYHLAFDPSWEVGFKHGSFWAQDVADLAVRLRGRDASLVAVSNAPLAKLQAHLRRTGRGFKWVSSLGTDFARDFGTALDQTGVEDWEHEGVSVFHKDGDGNVYHTYSAYASATG
ncbi:MAG TPA: DUF899 family protein [Candidatus Acidoferrum sp.]|nr:DUF899 family protein [Candidatus Acidoferrum sp.]